jgi:putative protein kinase ArgK-like GTPase of G3E family
MPCEHCDGTVFFRPLDTIPDTGTLSDRDLEVKRACEAEGIWGVVLPKEAA